MEGSGFASCSMVPPAAIIVEGELARLSAAAHMARTDARLTRRRAGTGPNGQRPRRAYVVATFRFGKVQPSSPGACRAAASCSDLHSM